MSTTTDPVSDPILEELRGIRADLNSERSWRKVLTGVLIAIAFVVAVLVGLAVNAIQQKAQLQRQGDALAAVVSANDYENCLRGNDTRDEIRVVLIELVNNYVQPDTTALAITDRLNDPKSPLAPRDCSVLPH